MTKKEIKLRLKSGIMGQNYENYCQCDEPEISNEPDGVEDTFYYGPFDYNKTNPIYNNYYICKNCTKKFIKIYVFA